ncbi:MAG: type I toxin-antitoxin system SymE family toxin [Chloroflexi bacterium]|nr:type I toxin-antitoxin system SymE family toxin [Chloroflexota bacterium]
MNKSKHVLKIREIGDFHYRKTRPQILLSGKWLAKAGFSPNQYVEVHLDSPGKITLTIR